MHNTGVGLRLPRVKRAARRVEAPQPIVKYGAKQIRKRKICIGEVRLLRICPRQVRTAEVQYKSDPSLSCDTKTGA